MKYIYPYREWIGGMVFFILISFYGVYLLYDIGVNWIFYIGYIALCYLFIDWYWNKIQLYRSKFIVIRDDEIEFSFDYCSKSKKYKKEEIEYIFNVNHRQRLKIHNVIHIFMKNGDYLYLTNEVTNFENLKRQLKIYFPKQYVEIQGTIIGVLEGNIKKILIDKLIDNKRSA
ncbi:hypothetical protein [Alkaliphilus transvaalensis]|uniref:hypothetical protein n=1 Tax=Alkaliphilus transvaalensis TaxID=114628 RepID=UPI00047CE947|nr:hypothetical protein [Alkaliphilus transvaalensis]